MFCMSPRRFVSSGSPWEELAGYSRAVVDGRWVFVSGTVGYDLRTKTWPPTAETQHATALDTNERAMRGAGATLPGGDRVRVYIPNRADGGAATNRDKIRI